MSQHSNFILKPISDVLSDALVVLSTIGDGIDAIPVSEYLLQSAFLRMTGFQEQKLKCIVWDLATSDYTYRYERFTRKPVGECSCYDEKNLIYKDLVGILLNLGFEITDVVRQEVFDETKQTALDVFSQSNLVESNSLHYAEFEQYLTEISKDCIMTNDNLFKNVNNCGDKDATLKNRCKHGLCMRQVFDTSVYRYRNQCAHNTQSYQSNLPTMETLQSLEYRYANYFIRFFILVLVDNIFRYLYGEYQRRVFDE